MPLASEVGAARDRRLQVDDPEVGLQPAQHVERVAPDVGKGNRSGNRTVRPLGQLDVGRGEADRRLVQTRIAWIREDLVDAPAEHHVAAQEQRDRVGRLRTTAMQFALTSRSSRSDPPRRRRRQRPRVSERPDGRVPANAGRARPFSMLPVLAWPISIRLLNGPPADGILALGSSCPSRHRRGCPRKKPLQGAPHAAQRFWSVRSHWVMRYRSCPIRSRSIAESTSRGGLEQIVGIDVAQAVCSSDLTGPGHSRLRGDQTTDSGRRPEVRGR